MSANEFELTEVRTYHLDHECNQQGCVKILRISLTTAQPQAAQAARATPPPNIKGWVDGYCPDHVPVP